MELGEEHFEVVDGVEVLVKNVQGDPTDGLEGLTHGSYDAICVERFTAAKADETKGMHSCYDESGKMVAVCRHGIVILMCDIVQSGEL